MDIRLLSPQDEPVYDHWVKNHPQGSLWQSLAWKQFQEALGREVRMYVAEENHTIVASALVVIDTTTMGLSTWEIPRGPLESEKGKVTGERNLLVETVIADAKKQKVMTLFLSPQQSLSPFPSHFSPSSRHIHPAATRILDLTLSENDLLAQMKPKGRYNIRLAEKHGIIVEQSIDIPSYARIATETASRDRFRGHSARHYRTFLESLPGSFLLLAYAPNTHKPIAGLLGAVWGTTGIYYYGASSNEARNLMAPYLLQWEAMRLCRRLGCTTYDLFGIAPEGATNHPWAGVTDFKAKFGGGYVEYPPEQQIVLRPVMKTILDLKRKLLG